MAEQKEPPISESEKKEIIKQAAGRFLFTAILMICALFLSAGKLGWWEGWAYIAVVLSDLLVNRTLLLLKYPDRIQERMDAAKKENVKPWDRVLVPLVAVILPLAAWIVAGLDERFGWSPDLPDGIQLIALAAVLAGILMLSRATFINRNFSSHVRIQSDRGHAVATSGPYRFIRHPGYAGEILSWLAVPVFFSSTWVGILTVLAVIAYVIRTALEDRTLQKELPGYREYAQSVRYRLIPGIW